MRAKSLLSIIHDQVSKNLAFGQSKYSASYRAITAFPFWFGCFIITALNTDMIRDTDIALADFHGQT